MKYEVRIAGYEDLKEISAVEKATMGNYTYVETAWNYFMNSKGDFLCAYDNGKIVGIAHIAILPDGCGWFEALRVHPEHQNKGVGKALYEKAIDLIDNKYHCPSFSMYTGPRNVRSASLAEKFGLSIVHDFKEYNLKVNSEGDPHNFRYADWKRAEELLLPSEQTFMSFNRTMYYVNKDNIRSLADMGFFYEDNGTVIGSGARFQHGSKLFIGIISGDYKKALDFAVNIAHSRNIENITCTFEAENNELEKALKDYGFDFVAELITKERKK